MSAFEVGGASFFQSVAPATSDGGAGLESMSELSNEEAGSSLRQRLERAAFPAVFLTLLGTPVQAEVPASEAVGEIAVPLEDGEMIDFDQMTDLAFLLGEELEYVDGGLDAALDFWQLGEQMAQLAPSDNGESEFALIQEFRALLDLHEAIVGPYARGDGELGPLASHEVASTPSADEGESARPIQGLAGIAAAAGAAEVADTLTGWGFNPEFQTRLARVVERMRSEYGLDVEVIEGFREQSRQDDLWAQGRTRPGPVVTWTRESRHTVGAAADLHIDGDWVKGRGALLLSRVAAEEGLRTLGPRDPGHIELPGDLTRLAAQADELELAKQLSERFRPVPSTVGTRRDGEGARGVARVAPVANVARVARPGGELAALPTPMSPTPEAIQVEGRAPEAVRPEAVSAETKQPEAVPAPSRPVPQTAEAAAAARLDRLFRAMDDTGDEGSSDGGELRSTKSEAPGLAPSSERSLESWVRRVGAGAPGLDMIRRVEAIRNAEPRDALRRVMIALEGADATEVGRVRLDVRGDRVNALFDIDDAGLARRIERDMAALRTQLAAEGVDPGRLRVRTGGGELAPAGAEVRVDATRSSSSAEGGRERGEGHSQQDGQDQRDLTERRREFREDRPAPRDTDMEDES